MARTPVTHPNLERIIAHDRRPPPEYLKQRGVNIRIFAPASSATAALRRADYAVKVGPDLWMPFNTVNAQWAAARFAGRDLRANKIFSTIDPAHNQFHVDDNTYVGERFLGHFGDGLDGWRLIGEAVSNYGQHALNEGQELIWGRADSDFLTSYHPSKGNEATGKALSPKFTATADQYLVFLIAGGGGEGVGLRLLDDRAEVAVWNGRNTEQFELIVHPLAYVAGKSLQLELFDNEHGDWGHIMLDHVMLVACDTCQMAGRMTLARALNAQPSDDDTVYLIPSLPLPGSRDYFNVKYLYQGTTPVHIVRMDAPNLEQKVEYTLATMKNVSMVKVVEWNTVNRRIDDDIEPLAFLLTKYGRYLSSDEYDDFQVHNYVDISLERPWTFYEYMEPLTVQYDGGISLYGLALGQGEEQLSTQHPLDLGQERSLWGVLRWQTAPGLEIDYAISLRLYNAEGERAYQADDVLWQTPNHVPTSHWSAHEPVNTLVHLDFPPDIPAGDYELRMVVYNFETQVPTVELGVWEPETTLARLRLAEAK